MTNPSANIHHSKHTTKKVTFCKNTRIEKRGNHLHHQRVDDNAMELIRKLRRAKRRLLLEFVAEQPSAMTTTRADLLDREEPRLVEDEEVAAARMQRRRQRTNSDLSSFMNLSSSRNISDDEKSDDGGD